MIPMVGLSASQQERKVLIPLGSLGVPDLRPLNVTFAVPKRVVKLRNVLSQRLSPWECSCFTDAN